jgi:UDP-3-O-[3-hydroxymyristoyl] glucosamine N-acyltransferase
MKLSEFFKDERLKRDIDVSLTHFTNQSIKGIVCFATSKVYISQANKNKNVYAVITNDDFKDLVDKDKGLVVSKNPKKDYYELHNFMFKNGFLDLGVKSYIDKTATIAPTAIIEDGVSIAAGVRVGEYTIIRAGTVIKDNTFIGSHCSIGARGLNNTKIDDKFIYVEDAGGVEIGQNCEILDGSIIQKSIHKEMTTIGDYTKISVMVNIAHGCIIGQKTLIAGNAQLSGYVTVGNNVWIGPSSTIAHNLTIQNNVEIKIGSVVVKSVKQDSIISGNFAYKHSKHLKNFTKAQR